MDSADTSVKLSLTALSAIVCIATTIATKGESGVGWFILSLLIIW
jgi:hypothetical protein